MRKSVEYWYNMAPIANQSRFGQKVVAKPADWYWLMLVVNPSARIIMWAWIGGMGRLTGRDRSGAERDSLVQSGIVLCRAGYRGWLSLVDFGRQGYDSIALTRWSRRLCADVACCVFCLGQGLVSMIEAKFSMLSRRSSWAPWLLHLSGQSQQDHNKWHTCHNSSGVCRPHESMWLAEQVWRVPWLASQRHMSDSHQC